ncbi:conserved hypothetical protein [Ricinus communis]|uniref:Uncharacterized protein n=1 Tax=Ricinus communis TaxID=3988 RepID=B9RFM1_RICCO|nr:conserved hypothetical protein [Ricinus communis]
MPRPHSKWAGLVDFGPLFRTKSISELSKQEELQWIDILPDKQEVEMLFMNERLWIRPK